LKKSHQINWHDPSKEVCPSPQSGHGDGSVAAIDVEKALSELHFHHPPSAVLNEIEIALSKMVKEIVLAGNAPLRAVGT
jgi:hypothetical protein